MLLKKNESFNLMSDRQGALTSFHVLAAWFTAADFRIVCWCARARVLQGCKACGPNGVSALYTSRTPHLQHCRSATFSFRVAPALAASGAMFPTSHCVVRVQKTRIAWRLTCATSTPTTTKTSGSSAVLSVRCLPLHRCTPPFGAKVRSGRCGALV